VSPKTKTSEDPGVFWFGRNGNMRTGAGGRWLRFLVLVVITALLLLPVTVPVWRLLAPNPVSGSPGGLAGLFEAVARTLAVGPVMTWLTNSISVTAVTVVVAVAIAAPAGYVVSRGRGRGVRGFALVIFTLQAVPILLFLIPLFVLFAELGLNDTLPGVTLIYIGLSTAVATWTMSSYFDSIPAELEEAAWIDGCSVFGGFLRVVLRNSLPGVLSAAVYAFLFAWNDYWIALVFLRSDVNYTLGLALAGPGSFPAVAVIAMMPPLIIFAVLNRYFSLGGIGGALAGR
jgi:multiple sugar transport system permease protein